MFNARSETVATKSVFNRLLSSRRCVVTFNGFYEWKSEGGRKQPYYVNFGEEDVMHMAGLYDVWKGVYWHASLLGTDCLSVLSPRSSCLQDS